MERQKKYDETKFVYSTNNEGIKELASHIKSGEVVAFPTETVYGLGANAFDSEAVKKIFEAKGRPGDNPLICHIYDKSQIKDLVSEVTPLAQKLIDCFMPGPITVIMKKSERVPDEVTAGLDTVGVRMPSNLVAAEFLKYCECPVAAPSANLSGSPSPTKAEHVLADMDGYIYGILDGGMSTFGLESTVVDCTGEMPVILRPGAVTKEAIDKVTCELSKEEVLKEGETPKAPGMKYRHYAPKASVEIINLPKTTEIINDQIENIDINEETEELDFKKMDDDSKQAIVDIAAPFIWRAQELLKASPLIRIGIFAGHEVRSIFEKMGDKIMLSHIEFFDYGKGADVSLASHYLFEGMRMLDIQDVSVILAQGFEGEGLSAAYMNRLGKAAGKTGEVTDSMPQQAKALRQKLPLDFFRDTYTASVLFVCDDNVTMSPACESLFRTILDNESPYRMERTPDIGCEIYCESAGLKAYEGDKKDETMDKALKELTGKSILGYKTLRAEPSVYDANDLILTMRDEQTFNILSTFPELEGKVFSLSSYAASKGLVFKSESGKTVSVSIPNPKGENFETYKHTVSALKAWLEILFPYIVKDLGAQRC